MYIRVGFPGQCGLATRNGRGDARTGVGSWPCTTVRTKRCTRSMRAQMVPDGSTRSDFEAGATRWVLRTGGARRTGYTVEPKSGRKSCARASAGAGSGAGQESTAQRSIPCLRQAQCLTSKRDPSQRADQRCGQTRWRAKALHVQEPSARTRADDHWLFSHGPGVRRVSEAGGKNKSAGRADRSSVRNRIPPKFSVMTF